MKRMDGSSFMKHTRFLLILLFLLYLNGCAPSGETLPVTTEPPQESETTSSSESFRTGPIDSDLRYKKSFIYSFIETEDYYAGMYCMDNYLHIYDKTSGFSGVLCGKPDCMHKDSSCDAYIGNLNGGLSYYDGQLYWLGPMAESLPGQPQGISLWRMNLNGSGRECCLDAEGLKELLNGKQRQIATIHRGYFYLLLTEDIVVEGVPHSYYSIYASSLGNLEQFTCLMTEAITASSPTFHVFWVEDMVYINCRTVSIENEKSSVCTQLLACSLKDGTKTELLNVSDTSFDFYETQYVDEQFYFSGTEDGRAVLYRLSDGKLERCFDFYDEKILFGEAVLSPYLVLAAGINEEGGQEFWFRTLQGETLWRGPLNVEILGLQSSMQLFEENLVGGKQDEAILFYSYAQGGQVKYCFVRYRFANGEMHEEVLFTGDERPR